MGAMKRWLEDNWWQFSTKELRSMGLDDETIDVLRECCPKPEEGT